MADEATAAVASLAEIDRLDVGDPADEDAHGYAVDSRVGDLRIGATVAIAPAGPTSRPSPTRDGSCSAARAFRVRNTRTGRDLMVVVRTRTPTVARFLRVSG